MAREARTLSHLFCFGYGYCAQALAARLAGAGWRLTGTATTAQGTRRLEAQGHGALLFDGSGPGGGVGEALQSATHVLVSAPPDEAGDLVLRHHAHDLAGSPVGWIGYLSTVGVYGDRQGGWVDESDAPRPLSQRSRQRLAAEEAWTAFAERTGKRVQIFRLAGIYGPGRCAIDGLRRGTAHRIIKPDQVFNRIHVDDIASVLAVAAGGAGRHVLYNVADDEPAPPQDVVAYAAELIGVPPPPEIPFENARLSPMAASFYAENKRVRNDRLKQDLGLSLAYPTYRDGLRAIAALKD